MCGRFFIESDIEDIIAHYGLKQTYNGASAKGEIFPGTKIPIVLNNKTKELNFIKWGFQVKGVNRELINARVETVSEKPAFRKAFINNRCLIPANAFFEWSATEKNKVKYKIEVEEEGLFSMAGLYDKFVDRNNKEYFGVVILTRPANEEMSKLHNRMPVILAKEKENEWLSASEKEILNIQKDIEMDPFVKLKIYPADGIQQMSFIDKI
ncbi:SOS response-associated peptidase [Candidatus Clostridium stratigraminis]|uniref:Abasic site processing protein n=1 Tax=Candidatus Clostridium stratigraminis TaxID=3381661 RepID=A0ABW8T1E8_9CLOT